LRNDFQNFPGLISAIFSWQNTSSTSRASLNAAAEELETSEQ